jgi:ABC-type uncharacterized transport system involved in gliding motility auxiliary subunit
LGLALGVVGLLALLAGAIIFAVVPELRDWALALLAVSLLAFVAFGYLARRLVGQFLSTRQGRYGLNTLIMVASFTAILVLVNFLSFNVNARVDVTATGQFTLAPQTESVLRNLEEPVVAYGFFTPDDPAAEVARGLLREYEFAGENFSYEIIDPETDPARASRYRVDQYGTVVFVAGDEERVTRTTDLTEQSFTSALLRATGQGLKTVCFLSGHGERSILGTTPEGMSLAAQALEQELYVVRDFSFSSSGGVPEECAVVVVAGPDRDLSAEQTEGNPSEGQMLRSYLAGGGNLLMLLTPTTPQSWLQLLREGGIEAGGGAVIDPANYAQPDRATPQIRPDQYLPDHPITAPLIERSRITFFPLVTRVAPMTEQQLIEENVPPIPVYPLIFTTDRSWLETDLSNLANASYDQAVDRRGPISIAAAEEFPAGANETGRIVAVGNASFAGNQFFYSLGNSDLFLNSVNWLAEQEDLISIRPTINSPRLLIITQRQADWILYSSVGLLPALLALVGAWTWWRRR